MGGGVLHTPVDLKFRVQPGVGVSVLPAAMGTTAMGTVRQTPLSWPPRSGRQRGHTLVAGGERAAAGTWGALGRGAGAAALPLH